MQILIVRLDHMGDVALTVAPVVDSIKETFPDAQIDVVCSAIGAGLLEGHPRIRSCLVLDPPWAMPVFGTVAKLQVWARNLSAFWRSHGIRGAIRYDWIIYLSLSHWERCLIWMRGRRRVGFEDPGGRVLRRLSKLLLTDIVAFDLNKHTLDSAVDMVGQMLTLKSAVRMARLVPSADVQRLAARFRAEFATQDENLLVIHAGSPHSMKAWKQEGFLEVARSLSKETRLRPVFVGVGHEVAAIVDRMRETGIPFRTAETPGVRDLMAAALSARLFIANDGGPMHVAAALGVPTVGIFGPTDERLFGPRGIRSVVVRESGICGARHYPWSVPACCSVTDRACLKGIRTMSVLAAARAMLDRTAGGAASAQAWYVEPT